ncbi:MAG: NosD domain-containing protein [Thermoplasmata archaeon]
MRRRSLAVALLLFAGACFVGMATTPNARAAVLYVGGMGPGNYTTIQDAVDFANPGDTIFVFSGTYIEQVSVYKPLTMVGEDRNTTTVDGDMIGDVIRITSDLVSISGFTLTNGGPDFHNGNVHLLNVQNCNITDNNMASSFGSGIVLEDSDNNIIEGNIVDEHGWSGIELLSSHGNAIANNTLTSNYMHGLILSSSNFNYIIDNAFSASELGIYVEFSLGNTFHGNEMVDTGLIFWASWATVEYYNTHTISTSNTVNGKPVHYWKDADGGRIPSGAGQVILANCTNVTVENQNVSHSTVGIQLGFSSNNTIANNTASHGGVGIFLEHSRDNLIVNNTANHNIRPGTGTWFGLYMRFSDNNTLTRNTASDNMYGIVIHDSSGNTVSNNTVSKNSQGITLWYSTGTVVFENALSSNGVGVYSDFGVNRIFHNSFTDNTEQARQNGGAGIWDDGYPSGGNYWSDYNGTDNYSGPNQDQPGPDGIGDTPYPIDAGGQDNYPLMEYVDSFVPDPNASPISDAGDLYAGQEGTPIFFDGTGSHDPDGSIVSYEWDFGCGHVGSGVTTSHAYGKAGVYDVCLTVTDDDGAKDADCTTANIANVDPIVTAQVDTTTVDEGSSFLVNGSFYDPGWNDTHDAEWDFIYPDTTEGRDSRELGVILQGPGPGNATHDVAGVERTFGDDGNYAIYLNVTDEFGGLGSYTVDIVVKNVPPVLINITSILHQNAPRKHDYWKYQCKVKKPNEEHPGILQIWIDAIREQSAYFTDIHTKDDVCDILKPRGRMDSWKQADLQLMALWLNIVSGLLWTDSPLHHPLAPDDHTVREFIRHAEQIMNGGPSSTEAEWVATIAENINGDADGRPKPPDWSYIDPVVGEYLASAYDVGTDDLTFIWREEPRGIDYIHYHFNDGHWFEEEHEPDINEVRTPYGSYPFEVVDFLVVGHSAEFADGIKVSLRCLMDDDGGMSASSRDCGLPEPNPDPEASVDWSFQFNITYEEISGGFTVAVVDAQYMSYDPQVVPRREDGDFN